MISRSGLAGVVIACLGAGPLRADTTTQFWITSTVSKRLDALSELQFEATQRFRPDEDGGDQQLVRLSFDRSTGQSMTAGVGLTRVVSKNADESRLHQQLRLRRGVVRARTRLEQRFFDGAPRTGWRLRQRIGAEMPLKNAAWRAIAHGEFFLTLRDSRRGGSTGLTAVRATIAAERQLGAKLRLSVGYLHQRTIVARGPNQIAHIPQLALTLRQ